jgi:hypothetical protein
VTESPVTLPPVGKRAMADYRAYRIKDDHVAGMPDIVVADNDEEAIGQAKGLTNGHDVELWAGPRFVIGIKSTDPK